MTNKRSEKLKKLKNLYQMMKTITLKYRPEKNIPNGIRIETKVIQCYCGSVFFIPPAQRSHRGDSSAIFMDIISDQKEYELPDRNISGVYAYYPVEIEDEPVESGKSDNSS